MSTLSSANVTHVNLVLKERTHMPLCLNMLIFTHNLGNWLIVEEPILLTPPTSGPIACNQLKLAPPGRWREPLHLYSVVVCVDNRS